MRLETELNIALTEFLRPIVEQCFQDAIQKFTVNPAATSSIRDATPYGDFHWLCDTCPGIPASTLRIKSAAGEIPGVVKFGKRVLYEKAVVLNWLRSQTRTLSNAAPREQDAESQFTAKHQRRGGRKAA